MEHFTDTSDMKSRIAVLESEVKNVVEELKEIRIEQREQHDKMMKKLDGLDNRISNLEKWRWMLIGAAVVAGYVLGHISIEKLF